MDAPFLRSSLRCSLDLAGNASPAVLSSDQVNEPTNPPKISNCSKVCFSLLKSTPFSIYRDQLGDIYMKKTQMRWKLEGMEKLHFVVDV